MTDFDIRLIEKANTFSRWAWRELTTLMAIADTDEARERILDIQWTLRDLVEETL